MKFLSCSRCLSAAEEAGSSRRSISVETTDPLMTTKRYPSLKSLRKNSLVPEKRFSRVLRVLSSSWRRRKSRPKTKIESRHRAKKRDPPKNENTKNVEIRNDAEDANVNIDDGSSKFLDEQRSMNNSAELEQEYYEYLKKLKFLADRPIDQLDNIETRQNFRNKLNTLDLKRINTVAIPDDFKFLVSENQLNFPNGLHDVELSSPRQRDSQKFCMEPLNEIIREHMKIEQTMINLLNRGPILKKPSAGRKEAKTVRFDVEEPESFRTRNHEEETVGGPNRMTEEIVVENQKIVWKEAEGLNESHDGTCPNRPPVVKASDGNVQLGSSCFEPVH